MLRLSLTNPEARALIKLLKTQCDSQLLAKVHDKLDASYSPQDVKDRLIDSEGHSEVEGEEFGIKCPKCGKRVGELKCCVAIGDGKIEWNCCDACAFPDPYPGCEDWGCKCLTNNKPKE